MAQQKLQRKDFQIAVKTGTTANLAKFKKEAVKGELYFATDSPFNLYIALTTAGASDSTVKSVALT
jgi:hypothetical protein